MKQTKYFAANTTYASHDAHKAARAFLAEMQLHGYVGFESTYGNHGYSVTWWKKDDAQLSGQALLDKLAD